MKRYSAVVLMLDYSEVKVKPFESNEPTKKTRSFEKRYNGRAHPGPWSL